MNLYLEYSVWSTEFSRYDSPRQVKVILPDGTRGDSVTDTHVIELDFGDNWASAIGQSSYHSISFPHFLTIFPVRRAP